MTIDWDDPWSCDPAVGAPAAKQCAIDWCAAPSRSRGLCKPHYEWAAYRGFPEQLNPPRTLADWLAERWVEDPETGCWNWTSALSDGYGVANLKAPRWIAQLPAGINPPPSGQWKAHRLSYIIHWGPIPDGLTLDHLCRNTRCVNPGHLEPVTNKVNILRSDGISAMNARKTHCKRGHEFTPENTRMQDGKRCCRTCGRGHVQATKYRKRIALAQSLLGHADARCWRQQIDRALLALDGKSIDDMIREASH